MTGPNFLTFNDGNRIPQLGFGVWQAEGEDAVGAVEAALDVGYRHIDTAAAYENEAEVGEAILQTGLPREDLFVTTKLWNNDQGFDSALTAFDQSLKRLGLEYVDLYLIHWPAPKRNLFVETWRAFIRLKEEGRARSIGVSNFTPEHLTRLIDETGVVPALNQVELHPRFQQHELREFHKTHGILTESWSPLGQGRLLKDPIIQAMADKHDRKAAQIIIRWHLQNSLIVIPKSVTPSRIAENFNVFDFELDLQDMEIIRELDSESGRVGPNPMTAAF